MADAIAEDEEPAGAAKDDEDVDEDKHRIIDIVLTRVFPGLFVATIICVSIAVHWYGWESMAAIIFRAIDAQQDQRVLQAIGINLFLVLTVTLCMPGPLLFILMDGFFFGFWLGLLLVLVAEVIAALLSLFIARSCCQRAVRSYLMRKEVSREVILVCEEDQSGILLILFRFLAMPLWVKNYSLAILDISVLKFILVSLPPAVLYGGLLTYMGSKAYLVADEFRRGNTTAVSNLFSGVEVAVVALSIAVALVMTLIGWRQFQARRAAILESTALRRHEETPATAA